jgi:branched-chain amino acid transport system permease protein
MDYFLALTVSGLLSGAVYALVGVAFIVVYRASAVLNFSLGEWVSLGARTTAASLHGIGLPVAGAVAAGLAVMALVAIGFSRIVIRPLIGRPVVAIVMATLALGVFLRGGAAISLGGLPSDIPFPLARTMWWWGDIPIPPSRVIASGVSIVLVLAVIAFFRISRAGIAIRAIADDPQAASAMGMSVTRYLALAWVISAALCVAGGVLWSIDGLGGFGMGLVLAKVLPVVVIGGLTSFGGAFLGAILVGLAENWASGYLDPFIGTTGSGSVIAAVMVIATLWLSPSGLFGAKLVQRV